MKYRLKCNATGFYRAEVKDGTRWMPVGNLADPYFVETFRSEKEARIRTKAFIRALEAQQWTVAGEGEA